MMHNDESTRTACGVVVIFTDRRPKVRRRRPALTVERPSVRIEGFRLLATDGQVLASFDDISHDWRVAPSVAAEADVIPVSDVRQVFSAFYTDVTIEAA